MTHQYCAGKGHAAKRKPARHRFDIPVGSDLNTSSLVPIDIIHDDEAVKASTVRVGSVNKHIALQVVADLDRSNVKPGVDLDSAAIVPRDVVGNCDVTDASEPGLDFYRAIVGRLDIVETE